MLQIRLLTPKITKRQCWKKGDRPSVMQHIQRDIGQLYGILAKRVIHMVMTCF
jgi:hypothetical protein